MSTLVLTSRYSADSNAMWGAAVRAGWEIERVRNVAGFQARDAARDVAFYGETLLADALSERLGITLLEPDYGWLPALPKRWRGREVALTTYGDACGLTGRAFVKPVDEKWFQARVYADGAELREAAGSNVGDDALVLVQEPVRFVWEFRAFVLNRSPVQIVPYICRGEICTSAPDDVSTAVSAFARRFLEDHDVALPPAVVVDFGLLEDGTAAVVEANAAWASGLCGSDPDVVLGVVRRSSVPTAVLTPGERRWARGLHS